MDEHLRLGRFLRARRARVTPTQVGLPATGHRRVAGLRREELAGMAGVSLDYYTRLEQGRETRPSPLVLDALARPLRLSAQERRHLHALVGPPRLSGADGPEEILPSVRRLLDMLADTPAFVLGRHADILDWTPIGAALLGAPEERNVLRLVFLDPRARALCPDWDAVAVQLVAWLRTIAARRDCRPGICRLVDDLQRSPAFVRLWERHDVAVRSHGAQTFDHPEAGRLLLTYDAMALGGHQTLLAYTPADGSARAALERLRTAMTTAAST
jgi:transcriptional regulator with XRE-family HTH domain